MPEDLAAGLVLFRTTFRRQLGPIVLMWPGLLMSCCLFGLPLWVLAVVGLVAASLGDHGRPANAAWRAAVLVAGLGLSIGAASLILAFATQPWSAEAGVPWMLVEIALCAAVALLHAPFFFAPFAACDLRRPEGLGEAVGFSFELSARQGLGATLSTAIVPIVLTHAAMTLGFLGVHVLSQSEEPGLGLAVACAGMFALPFAWALGLAFVGARYARLVGAPRAAASSDLSGLRVPLLVLVPALLAATAAVVAAATSPAMPERVFDSVPPDAVPLPLDDGALPVPGTETTVRLATGAAGNVAILVEADDGGGAGAVATHFRGEGDYYAAFEAGAGATRVRIYGGAVEGFAVARVYELTLDPQGVRLDDTPRTRLERRLGPGAYLLPAAFLLLLGVAGWLARQVGQARVLDAPPLEGAATDGRLHALLGTLHLGEGGSLLPAGASARVTGEVRFEADALRFRLPPGAAVRLVGGEPEPGDAVLLSRFSGTFAEGLRAGPAAWPEDGVLVPGGLDVARAALVARAVRRAAIGLVPALAGILFSTGWILARW
jgi:hypothetical protein